MGKRGLQYVAEQEAPDQGKYGISEQVGKHMTLAKRAFNKITFTLLFLIEQPLVAQARPRAAPKLAALFKRSCGPGTDLRYRFEAILMMNHGFQLLLDALLLPNRFRHGFEDGQVIFVDSEPLNNVDRPRWARCEIKLRAFRAFEAHPELDAFVVGQEPSQGLMHFPPISRQFVKIRSAVTVGPGDGGRVIQ